MKNSFKNLVEIPEVCKPVRRHRRKWKDNIKVDVRKIGFEVMDLIYLA